MKISTTYGLRAIAVGASMLLIASCTNLRPVPLARIHTPGVTIKAIDGSFSIQGTETAKAPFSMDCGTLYVTSSRLLQADTDTLLNSTHLAIERGAKPVLVHYPGRAEPLHGLLAFCAIPGKAKGDGKGVHSIVIPPSYVDQASSATVVLHSRVHWRQQPINSWILWLSSEEIR